ncbi:Hexokinase-2 [Geodia barretti]|nr:Hexokinase-2 [Geodia barretti]
MREISKRLTAACEKGLENEEKAVVKMFITYVHSLPDGTEEGDFLALDLGGSNFRVLQLSLERGGKMTAEPKVEEMRISKEKKEGNQEELFDFIAESMSDFLKKHGITRRLPLGFTFSFPVVQTSLTAGTLKKWTKDFKAAGAEGRDVTQMLQEAIARRKSGDVSVDVVALLNDTTGTQLAVGFEDPNCHVGLILGTGTNACYMEKTAAIPKFTGDRSKFPDVIVNCEWGAFGEDGSMDDWLTDYDKAVEEKVINRGQQIFEKLISGKYLGSVTHAALLKLTRDKVLFGGVCSERFSELVIDRFDSAFLSVIEGENGMEKCKELFKKEFPDGSVGVRLRDCQASV